MPPGCWRAARTIVCCRGWIGRSTCTSQSARDWALPDRVAGLSVVRRTGPSKAQAPTTSIVTSLGTTDHSLAITTGIRTSPSPTCSAVALLFLIFFPGILQQGAATYADATGQTQDPFLERWLLLSAGIFTFSAVAYAVRLLAASRSRTSSAPPGTTRTRTSPPPDDASAPQPAPGRCHGRHRPHRRRHRRDAEPHLDRVRAVAVATAVWVDVVLVDGSDPVVMLAPSSTC